MNNKIVKKIRKIIPPTNEINRRNYQRAKEKYKSLSKEARPIFIEELSKLFNSHGSSLNPKESSRFDINNI
jgi:hypothetical protein